MKIRFGLFVAFIIIITVQSVGQNKMFSSARQDEMVNDELINSKLLVAALNLKEKGNYVSPQELESQATTRTGQVRVNTIGINSDKFEDYYEVQKHKTLIIARLWNQPDGQKDILYKGCAFPITNDGICVTNHHIFRLHPDKMEDILFVVMDFEGNVYEIEEVLTGNYQDDLALFKLKEAVRLNPISLGTEPKVGDEVKLISHPAGDFYHFSKGYITRSYWYAKNQSKRMSMTADFAVGSSGAPVCDSYGNLIGVVANTYYLPQDNSPQIIVKEISPVNNILKLIATN